MPTKLVRLSENIRSIDQGMVRAYLITGKSRALLLDTGMEKADIVKIISSVTDLPVTLCLTHSDPDHIGNLMEFSEAFLYRDEIALLNERIGKTAARLHALSEEDIFDLGGIKLTVIHTPGHTDGSLSLLDEENRILFSGDTVSYGPVFMFGKYRNMDSYISTLKRLNRLAEEKKFETVYPCHNMTPVSPEIIGDLILCAEGIRDHTLEGTVQDKVSFGDVKPLLYRRNKCMILY